MAEQMVGRPFQKGQSGNPGGRPRGCEEVRELARAFTTEAVTTLVEVMKRGKSEGARISAANTLLERGWGKPITPIEHTGRDGGPIETAIVSARSVIAERLAALASRSLIVRPEREGRIRHVTVYGQGYTESGGSREMRPRSEFDPLTGQVSPNSVIEVWLEQLDPALGEDFGWHRIAGGEPTPAPSGGVPHDQQLPIAPGFPEQSLRADRLLAPRGNSFTEGLVDRVWLRPPLWDGRVTVPVSGAGQPQRRLVVAEYEEYPIDGAAESYSTTSTRTGRRLVFIEHVALD